MNDPGLTPRNMHTEVRVNDTRLGIGICKTGDSPQRFLAVTRAKLVARYRMHSVPGRPEELVTNDSFEKTISFAFAGGEMRIRQHGGDNQREWVDHRDFRLRDHWLLEVFDYLDPFFGYIDPKNIKAPGFNHPNTGFPLD